jgi:hypothetical protein
MEFKTRTSSTFIMNMILIALALGMAIFSFFYTGFRYGIFKYSYILWLFIGYIRLRTYSRYIYLILSNKPALIVNESYIYDLANEIKYYWKDIDEINEDNAYLYIKLYNPAAYLSKTGRPVKRFMNGLISNPYKTPFVINADMVDVHLGALLEILDDYSIKANETENSLTINNL